MATRHRLRCEWPKSFITGSHITLYIHKFPFFVKTDGKANFPHQRSIRKHSLTMHAGAYPIRAMSCSFCFSFLLEITLVLSLAFTCCLSCSTASVLNSLSCISTLDSYLKPIFLYGGNAGKTHTQVICFEFVQHLSLIFQVAEMPLFHKNPLQMNCCDPPSFSTTINKLFVLMQLCGSKHN